MKIKWELRHEMLTGRIITIRDAYVTYYAELPEDITTEEAVDDFIASYDFHGSGTAEALRSELQVYDYNTACEFDK